MASVFSPSKGTSRNTRVCRLLVDLCPCLLRDILRHDIPESQFKSKLKRKEGILKNKLLNKDQCSLLFPAPGQYYNNDYSDFDSALLYILIRTLCSYNAHEKRWGTEPRVKDVSVSACVERIRIARNKYVGHMSRFDMDDTTFVSIWTDIKRVVVELEKVLSPTEKSVSSSSSYEIEMDKLETAPLDPEMEQFYKDKIKQLENAFHEEQEKADHVRRNILANTRSRLSNHSNNCYVATNAVQAIIDQLKSKRIAIVAGCPGSGKTTTVLEVLNNLVNDSNESYKPAILDNPEHWDQVVNSSERMIIFLDNPLGKSNFDRLNFVKWEQKFENMISCSTNGNCFIVIGIRDIVLQEMIHDCRPNSLFTHCNTINISKGDFALDNYEKLQIITQYQIANNRELSENDKSLISKSQPYYGFPQTCFLFFTNESLFDLGVSFFSRPDKTLVNEIEKLRKSDKRIKKLQYYVLVYVLIYQTINKLYNVDNVVAEICSLSNLRDVEALEIKDIIDELDDIYVISKEDTNQEFMFRHQTIKEAVLVSFFKVNPKLVIKSCSLADIGELIRTDSHPTKDEEVVLIIAESEYQDIVDRFISFDPSCVELLECCVFNEWIGILEILFLKDETLLNRTDDYGMTLITYAALWKKKELFRYLYSSKANIKHVNKFGSCLHFCVLNEWKDLLDILFTNEPTLVDHTDAYNMTLIEYAANNNQKDMVLYLYNYKANIMNDFQTYNLFFKYCVDNNWHDILSVILENDKELVSVEVTPRHSMITYAASQEKLDLVKQFLDVIQPSFDSFDLNCLLQICVDNDWCDLLDTMFRDNSSLVKTTNKHSLLSYAARCDNKRMVEFLLKQGAEPTSSSFLENCIDNQWYEVLVDVLTEAPSLVDFIMGDYGFTLISYAASVSCTEAIHILLQHNANISSVFLNVCVDNDLMEVIETSLTQQPTLVNLTNSDGDTLIRYAAKMKKKDIVLLLLAHDALIKQDNFKRESLIQLCANNKWNDILEILLKSTSSILDINSAVGSTIFASETSEEMVMFLYKYIPPGSLSDSYVQMLFQNFVLQERFQALELLMRGYPACSFENAFDFFENEPKYIIPGEIDTPSSNLYGMPGKTEKNISGTSKRISDDLVYTVLCLDQSLVEDKTESPTFRYCLDNRPHIVISYMKKNNLDISCNLNIYSDSVILNAAFFGEKKIVLSLIDQWAKKTETTTNDMVKLMKYCMCNKWEDVIETLMNIERTFKPFLGESVVTLINFAAEKGLTQVVNILYKYAAKMPNFKYKVFQFFTEEVIDILINYNTEFHSNMFLCTCVDNELKYVIDRILSIQPGLINSTNLEGDTLICYAARTMKRHVVLQLLNHDASIDRDVLNTINFVKFCANNKWNYVLEVVLDKNPSFRDLNGIFGSIFFAPGTTEKVVVFLYKLIPFGSILYGNLQRLFRTFVLEKRFKALELLMQEYRECTTFEDALNYFEDTSYKLPNDVVYKILCIDESLAKDKTASPTFRYYLNKRPHIVLMYMEHHENAWNLHIEGESTIFHAAKRKQKAIVLCILYRWENSTETTKDDMVKLMRLCIDNQWEDIVETMTRMERTVQPFIGDYDSALMRHAANKGYSEIVNILVKHIVEKIDETDNYFQFCKKMMDNEENEILSILLQYHYKPEYVQNKKGESLFLYATSCGNRQMVEILVEKLDFKDYLGKDIDNVLQTCIENNWDGVILNLFSKSSKLVSYHKLAEVINYALTNNKQVLIASLLEHDKDFKIINKGSIIKHCVDHEWDDVLQVCLNNNNSVCDVLDVNGVPLVTYVARFGKETVMKQLYYPNSSRFGNCDTQGHTPIHYCIAKGWIGIVEMIVNQMPQLLVRTQYGVGCIHIAAFFGRTALVKSLNNKGETLTENTSFGCNAFQMILLGLRYDSKKKLDFPFRKQCKCFCLDIYEKELLTVKQFDSPVHNEYETLITYISLMPNFQSIDLDFPIDQYGNSILHYLVINDNQTLVNWVLEREDKLKLVKNGTELPSVFHIAAYLGRSELFKTLLGSDGGASCGNDSLVDAVIAGHKFAGQAVYNSPSGWINQDRVFVYDIKIKAVKYVEFQFGKHEDFDTILRDSLSVR